VSARIQSLVNAQVMVNRAVFEANQAKPRETYIDECVADALGELAEAVATDARRRKRHEMLESARNKG
jgi:hypothetical protein